MSVSPSNREHTRPAVSVRIDFGDTSAPPEALAHRNPKVTARQGVSPTDRGHMGTHTALSVPNVSQWVGVLYRPPHGHRDISGVRLHGQRVVIEAKDCTVTP